MTATLSRSPDGAFRGSLFALLVALAALSQSTGCSSTEVDVEIEDLVVGRGEVADERKIVTIEYVGMLRSGDVFDSSETWGPLRFQLETGVIYNLPEGRTGRVIEGLHRGVYGMRVGGHRRITIPPEMAYGRTGVPGTIPPNATLIFEVKLIAVMEPLS
jgi:FKBP-type peptidyl-prolyl cis-trans isomerase